MSETNDESDGGIDYSQLHVYAGPEMPDMSNMTIYARQTRKFHGVALQANIIGSSHFINIPELGYREVTSCRPIEMQRDGFNPVTRHYVIDYPEPRDVFTRHIDGYEITVAIEALEHDPEATFEDWDLTYTFEGDGPSAPTAIQFLDPPAWRTVHVYPEFDVDLYTKTEVEEL